MEQKTSSLLYCILVLSLITSCAQKITSLSIDKDKKLLVGKGYLLLGIDTNKDLYKITFSGPTSVVLTSQDLAKGNNYILSELEAGEYSIRKLFNSKYSYFSFNEEENYKFTITPKEISYVGHLEIVSIGYWYPQAFLQLTNRSSEAILFMKKTFPNILSNRSINYGGPGEDDFFSFLALLKGQKND